jgi:hypothetical protein
MVDIERALTAAVAERLGVDPDTDPYPRLIVTSSVATLRSTMEWWLENDQPGRLRDALRRAFTLLAGGLAPPASRGS